MGTIKRKAPPRKANPARKKREFARAYHSRERVLFVKGLPCSACGIVGYSENAHVPPKGEAGTGYKADAKWIVPLCGNRSASTPATTTLTFGCHYLIHQLGGISFVQVIARRSGRVLDLEKCAAETESAWKAHTEEGK